MGEGEVEVSFSCSQLYAAVVVNQGRGVEGEANKNYMSRALISGRGMSGDLVKVMGESGFPVLLFCLLLVFRVLVFQGIWEFVVVVVVRRGSDLGGWWWWWWQGWVTSAVVE